MWLRDYIKSIWLERALKGKGLVLGNDLSDLRNLAVELSSLGIDSRQGVTPVKQRRYLSSAVLEGQVSKGSRLGFGLKVFTSMSFAGLLALVGAIMYVGSAGPDNTFYSWKLGVESARVSMTTSELSRAELNIMYAEKRLEETRLTLADPNMSDEAKMKAVDALTSQTKKAVASISSNSNQSSVKTDLVKRLASVSVKQLDVLKANASVEVKDELEKKLVEAEEGAKTAAAKTLLIAASSDQGLSDLGVATKTWEDEVVEFRQDYLLFETEKTEVLVPQELLDSLTVEERDKLIPGVKVSITADFTANNTSAVAKQITFINTEKELISASTATPKDEVQRVEPDPEAEVQLTEEEKVEGVNLDSGVVRSGFRIEDPTVPLQ